MISVLVAVLVFLSVLAVVAAVYDLGKRKLDLAQAQAAVTLQSALLEYQERNDKALTVFLTSMKEVVRFTETERQAAKGSQLNQSMNGRWKKS